MSAIEIFNRMHVRTQRRRRAAQFADHDFLFRWAEKQIIERLQDIARDFSTCINLGGRVSADFLRNVTALKNIGTFVTADLLSRDVIADHEVLPFAPQSADLVISILDLHTVNDLPGALAQIKTILKPDGLFLACVLGGETLFELRESLMQAEIESTGGASPRVAPFADKPQLGELMQRAGFALPVIDSDIIRVSYASMFNLLGDLRGMGESNTLAARRKTFTPSGLFAKSALYYEEHFPDPEDLTRVNASFEVIFLSGWSPHQSQQQPLKPGSAQMELVDIL